MKIRALVQRVAALENAVRELQNTPWQQDKASVGPQSHAANKSDATPEKTTTVPETPRPPSNTNQAKDSWYKTLDGWKSLLEVVAIPFAIGYALVTYFGWCDMRHNFTIDQRAWVGVKGIYMKTMGTAFNDPIHASIRVINTGKTVGMLSNRGILTVLWGYPKDIHAVWASKEWAAVKARGPAPIFPQGEYEYNIIFTEETASVLLKELLVSYPQVHVPTPAPPALEVIRGCIRSDIVVVYIIGEITYRDVFQDAHTTRYCAFYNRTQAVFEACEGYTDYAN